MLNAQLQKIVLDVMSAKAIQDVEHIQTLWSGYGEIVRVRLTGSLIDTVIVKYIVLAEEGNSRHPRGWNTQTSHLRKLKSYEVENHWYRDWSAQCDAACRVAHCYAARQLGDERIIILEDLDAAGFPRRFSNLDMAGVKKCLSWLANFHARFMGVVPTGLWGVGTYWHLQTRRDEWAAMEEGALKDAAAPIDWLLSHCQYQTLVHGDAKVANFCFADDMHSVAAVDFQYVGGGCGMKDVVYLIGSCLSVDRCVQWQDELLDHYFSDLERALNHYGQRIDWPALQDEWRKMFPVAWTDFYRFILGWSPTHHKINHYARTLATQTLKYLDSRNQ
jgi:hypothetical protein